jgi:hypothetical protein
MLEMVRELLMASRTFCEAAAEPTAVSGKLTTAVVSGASETAGVCACAEHTPKIRTAAASDTAITAPHRREQESILQNPLEVK